MGIRYLASDLRPFTERKRLENYTMVIDGPGLAYHIFNLYQKGTRLNATPTSHGSDDLGEMAVSWLKELETRGNTVLRILFDGSLPEWKRPTRMGRMRMQSTAMQNLQSRHPSGLSMATPEASTTTSHDHHSSFAVPTVLEALLQSDRYGSATEVVAGEADDYCALWARQPSPPTVVALLTGDSDLLIHDLGDTGNVIFFTDLEPAGDGFQAPAYSSAQIARHLSLPQAYGISAIAFERCVDSHASFPKILQEAQKAVAIKAHPDQYETFMSTYLRLTPEMLSAEQAGKVLAITGLDPRVSELAVKCAGSPPMILESGALVASQRPEMFLPPLTENWARPSVWETSASIRILAYTFLQQVARSGRVSFVWEHRRCLSESSQGQCLEVPAVQSLDDNTSSLLSVVRKIRQRVQDTDMQWILLSMFLDLDCHGEDYGKSIVHRVLRMETEADGTLDARSWDVIHWNSQINAAFYSLRMLSQVLGLLARESLGLSETSRDLGQVLSSLPSLAKYPKRSEMRDLPGRIKASGGLDVLGGLVDLSEPIEFWGKKKQKKKRNGAKRKRKERRPTAGQGSTSLVAQNPFAVLDGDGDDKWQSD